MSRRTGQTFEMAQRIKLALEAKEIVVVAVKSGEPVRLLSILKTLGVKAMARKMNNHPTLSSYGQEEYVGVRKTGNYYYIEYE